MIRIRLVTLFVGFCLLVPYYTPTQAEAANAFVRSCVNSNNPSGTTLTCTFSAGAVAQHNLISCLVHGASTTATATLADNQSTPNSYTVGTYATDSTHGNRGVVAYAKDTTGGGTDPTVVTVTWSVAVTVRGIICHEISGADLTAPADGAAQQVQLSLGTGTDGITSTAITPSANGAYLFGAHYDSENNGIGTTAGTDYTGATTTGSNPRSEYYVQPTAAAKAATFTPDCCTTSYATFIHAFKAASGATPDVTKFRLRLNQ